MRMPRPQFTIGRLMVLVVVAGLASWGVHVYRKLQTPSWGVHVYRKLPTPTIGELQALASYKQAILVREVAEYALKEYQQGIYLQDKAIYQGQINLAKSDLERATDRLKWSSEGLDEGRLSPRTRDAFLRSQHLDKDYAEFALEQARTQLEVLEKYRKDKQIKSLTSDVEKARADEQSKLESYNIERAKR